MTRHKTVNEILEQTTGNLWVTLYERRLLLSVKHALTPAEQREYEMLRTLLDAYMDYMAERHPLPHDHITRFIRETGLN